MFTRLHRFFSQWTPTFFGALALILLSYGLWSSSSFVLAYREAKRAHIFPTTVQSSGWDNASAALIQDLSPEAPFASFSQTNSAFIVIMATSSGTHTSNTSTPIIQEVTDIDAASSTIPGATDVVPLIEVTATSTPDTSLSPVTPDAQPSDVPQAPASTVPVSPDPVAPALPESPTQDGVQSNSSLPSSTSAFERYAEVALAMIAHTAYAKTTDISLSTVTSSPRIKKHAASTSVPILTQTPDVVATSTPDAIDDVANCMVLNKTCHTMEVSGFSIDGSITDKKFNGIELNISLGALAPDIDVLDSKLSVRYYHAGSWRHAGEIFINKELSNAANGGYFTEKLDGLEAWDDLSDVKVVLEYEPADVSSASAVYVDAVWLDALYQDRVQDVLAGDVSDPEDAPDNVTFDIAHRGGNGPSALVLPGGDIMRFEYIDGLRRDGLTIRANKKSGNSTNPDEWYLSITNTAQSADHFSFSAAFPQGVGSIAELSQFMRNVPQQHQQTVHDTVAYFCPDTWQFATSTGMSTCVTTGESHQCVSLNEAQDNCTVDNVTVATTTDTTYGSAWVPRTVVPATSGPTPTAGLPKGFEFTSAIDTPIEILPHQTIYLKLTLQGAVRRGHAVFVAQGDSLGGSLDTARLRNEKDLLAAAKQTHQLAPSVKRTSINDELSEKTDFGENEHPEFRFRFKTQRSFFTRVRDNLMGRTVPYEIKDARFVHNSGTTEHLPVDVAYDTNNLWTLRLGDTPRVHKPGKYTVDLAVQEGGLTYSDSLEFYWGVLAINANKSVYQPGETAHFSIAALDDQGDTMCGAWLVLTITTPSGAQTDVPVDDGGGCGHNNVTTLPDYIADFIPDEEGTYQTVLSRLDPSGNIVNSIQDSFTVHTDPEFVIERTALTRIYPVSAYTMQFSVTATTTFQGKITEVLPEGFTVPDAGGALVTRENGAIHLTWNASIAAGDTKSYSYIYKAPPVSPYLYLIGSMTMTDSTGVVVYDEGRTWKIASDVVAIATGVAWLNGTTTTNGTEWNNASAAAINWYRDDYDTTYFTHSTTTNVTRLSVNVAGDYLVAVNVPWERTDGSNTASGLEIDVRVNGVKQNLGVGRSGSVARAGTDPEASDHLYVLLHNLQVGDYIEAYSHAISTVGTLTTVVGTQASMYVEYIPTSETVFSAIATTTTSGTDLNTAATTSMVWYDVGSRVDSGYTHSNGTSPQNITLAAQADYMVFVNIPDDGAVTNARPIARVLLNGSMINGGDAKQGYISKSNALTQSSNHWSGIVHSTTTNSNLSVLSTLASAAGTLTMGSEQASIYIQKLPSSDLYFGRATTTSGGTNWNPAATTSILWQADSLKDTTTYTHSTGVNSQNITVLKAGDYLLTLNNSVTGAVTRGNPRVSVMLNGNMVNGAKTTTNYIRNTGGDNETSGSLVYLLRNLSANDVVSVQTINNTAAGTMTADEQALLMLWHKAAQSSYIQNTEHWFTNLNAEPPTVTWPGLFEGDSITTGNSVKSGDALRLRMALQVNATVAAGDTFKLQYAAGDTCSAALTWADVGATGSGSIWRFHDNAGVANDVLLSSTTLSVATVKESYQEVNPSTTTPNGITNGANGEWDWSLEDNAAPGGTGYCFRMVHGSGQLLKDYVDYPQLVTNAQAQVPTLSKLFDNEKVASTSPWFEFSSDDPNGETLDYQIQVSTDPAFGSTVINIDSATDFNNFIDVSNRSARAPFNPGATIRYTSIATLSNNTTYWWRVRARDSVGTNTWSSYSAARSFTVDTSVTSSTWFQTTQPQFDTDTMSQVNSTVTNDVQLTGANTSGTITSPAILYSYHTTGNSWGNISWTNTVTGGTILYQVEYFTSTSSWALIPNVDLAGNATGTSTQPINLSSLDPTTYNTIRIKANFSKTSATPVLSDWTLNWALSVAQPTPSKPFDNEKPATTTPQFQFSTTDPQGDKLQYQIQWSTDPTFTTGVTTRTSGTDAGFSNTASSTEVSPFTQNNTIQFWVQNADALTNGTTYWWRVRAKDPSGSNAYSFWSTARSLTVDTSLIVSTWFQTTTSQFNTDTLTRASALNNAGTAITDTGKIAIYRSTTATDNIMSTTTFNATFDTTVRQDDIYSMQYASSSIKLKAGYYAVLYGARYNSKNGTNRSEVQSNFSLASTSLPIGWSQAYIRRNGTATMGFTSGGGIIKVANDNDTLVLQAFRTDTNTTANVLRAANTAAIQLLRLDSAWDYLRLSKTTTQAGPTSANWVPVTYDREDEVDTITYGHTSGSASITLKQTGHYLIFANTYGSLATAVSNETTVDQKFTLGGNDIQGSFTTVYMRGNANADGDYQGAATVGMIIQSTTTNQVLTVQVARSSGTSAWKINGDPTGAYVDRTGITIVKIPDGDFVRLQNSTTYNMGPAARTNFPWNYEAEKASASFTHSTTTNTARVTTVIAGDYLFLNANYAKPATTTNAVYNIGWDKSGGALLTYGMGGGFSSGTAVTEATGAYIGTIIPSAINGDYYETGGQSLGTLGSEMATNKSLQAVRIASLTEADPNPQSITSSDIVFTSGTGPKWSSVSWNDTTPGSTDILYQVYYLSATSTYSLVPNSAIPGNSVGTTTSPIDISNLNRITYGTLRVKATLTCAAGLCPTLNDWTVNWAQGITISGTAKQFDQTTNVTSGTVAVAVNGVLQSGKTGTISGGTWSIANVTVFSGDVVTVYVSGATGTSRAVAITKYGGTGNITGMQLNELHLTLGSADNPTLSNADLSSYDNSVSGLSSLFFEVDGGNDLSVCAVGVTGCTTARLFILSGTTFRPNSGASGNVTTPYIQIAGTFTADNHTITVSKSWRNSGTFNAGGSTVIMTATSTTESINETGATTAGFYALTFGQTSGSAVWTLSSSLNASSTLAINFGTLVQNGANLIRLDGDFTIGASGGFSKGTATTTFMGNAAATWTDSTVVKQDVGIVVVDGATKTVNLGSGVRATAITIGSDDTLDVTASNYALEVIGDLINNHTFTARAGTVTFSATSSSHIITAGSSSFNNMIFNGTAGNWSFTNSTLSANDFTVTTGVVTMPTATTTLSGSFTASTGTFSHNNGAVLFSTASSGRTINPGGSSFYDIAFASGGAWSFTSTNATSSRNMTITSGTVTAPRGTIAIGGSFLNAGGTFTHNAGTLKFSGAGSQFIQLNGSDAYDVLFAGAATTTYIGASATSTGTITFASGGVSLPTNLTVTRSFLVTGGSFMSNSGTVYLNATTTGFSITPSVYKFYNLVLASSNGGWTITGNATTTHDFYIASSSSFTMNSGSTMEVQGTFTNAQGGAATTWTGSTLYLNSGTSYSINTKTAGADAYATVLIGANTKIRSWNSSGSTVTTGSGSSLYSQNNSAVNGDLYIYGTYTSPTDEYWNYSNDFDGTVLTGINQRQANVRFASGATMTFSSGTFRILGNAAATTTIANQGSGTYGISVTGGTLSAQYYQFRNLNTSGLALSGAPTVASLAQGDYELGVSGGTMITVASTVINQNPGMQIFNVRFATSTGVSSGYDVTETGTPSSTWWFRNSYGNYEGEAYDNDPGGNPGYILWDDSGFDVTIAGHVYADHGGTPIGNPPCDGSTQVVKIITRRGLVYTGSCNAGTGAYSIPHVSFLSNSVLTVFLDTNGGKRAVTVAKAPSADVLDMDLYQNVVILRNEDPTAITIDDLGYNDSTVDSDIFFATSTSPVALTVRPENELYIWPGKSFAPGGNVILQSGGSGDVRDGRLYVAASAAFTAAGTESHSVGGGMYVASGATFTPANSTVTFAATTTGKSIAASSTITFYNLTLNGSGGGWSLDGGSGVATTTISNAFAITTGTLSGQGDLIVASGNVAGSGTISMTGGTVQISGTGTFGGSSGNWQFKNLTLGSGSGSKTTAQTSVGTTTVTGTLTIAATHTFDGNTARWVLSGSGVPLIKNGTFNGTTTPFTYSGTGATTITAAGYSTLSLLPTSGSPTYTFAGGTVTNKGLIIGSPGSAVTVNANTNDPSMTVSGDVVIAGGSTFIASNVGALQIEGGWTNAGTFTHSSGGTSFVATTTGNTITPGNSPFYDLTFDAPNGGWTIANNATSSHDMAITHAANFTLSSGKTLEVNGQFTNIVGGATTTWTGSTLYLNSGAVNAINTKTTGGDVYGTLFAGTNTKLSSWNSSAATTTTASGASVYSQNDGGGNGALKIFGQYTRTSGSDYWSYNTDFDGTDITSTPRQVSVQIASSSVVTYSGGILNIIGASGATTTVANQGAGTYSFAVSGGTLDASYFALRNTGTNGLALSGTPTINSLSNADFELGINGGTTLTVADTVITANPLKVFTNNRFATSTGITSGFNVTATGITASYWKFTQHVGNLAGENFDNDAGGNPGFIHWDDSNDKITISGTVYSDEGSTVSTVCDNATQVVKLRVQGAGTYQTSCNSSTGAYSIPNVAFNPGDVLTLFVASSTHRAATISSDPSVNISGMDLYENRVIVRHEDMAPMTIVKMATYDSDQDSTIPFNATVGAPNTLVVRAETKLLIWSNKSFAPAGNVTLQSGGSGNAWDGTLELKSNAVFTASGTQTHSIGGSLLVGSGASIAAANSTITFTATTTGKTITPNGSSFYNVTFNGASGNWAFSGDATSTNDFTITNGNVTLSTGTTTIGGSFVNNGGTFAHNNGAVVLSAITSGKTVKANGSNFYNISFIGSGGTWTFTDTSATSSNNVVIAAGSVTLPAVQMAIGGSFTNSGGAFTSGNDTVKFTSSSNGKTITSGGSSFYKMLIDGTGGAWSLLDAATSTSDFTILHGTATFPNSVLAVGGSFVNAGTFIANTGMLKLIATTTGMSVTPGGSNFYDLSFDAVAGGWTLTSSATSTHDTSLLRATSFTQTAGTTLEVDGTFTNLVGGASTTWTNTVLYLNSGSSYSVNTKSAGGDVYGTLFVGANTNIRDWGSSQSTTTLGATGSLYSQNNAGSNGVLNIYGHYSLSSGSDYWSYATDFDGTALGGGSRAVAVQIASSSVITVSGTGSLAVIGASGATTTIANQGAGAYSFAISGGTFNANYYSMRNADSSGLNITGTSTITSLDNGDFQLGVTGGASITVSGAAIDANASKTFSNVRFATSTGISSGFNVSRTSVPSTSWTFAGSYGNYTGESYDNDGFSACGSIRWDDSSCQFVSQAHYRWRNDDGGEGAPNSEWYSLSWTKRKKIAISNPNTTAYTSIPVKIDVPYDSDMKASFDDLRFTDSTGTALIPFWRETTTSSGTSTLWVKVPSLPSSGSATIYMYFGNGGATAVDDLANTFPFAEDFESNTLTAYSPASGHDKDYFQTGTSFNHNGTYGLYPSTGNIGARTTAGGIYQTGSKTAQGKTIRYFQYVDSTQQDEPCTLFGVQAASQNYAVCLDEFPVQAIELAKNVSSNDGSGTVLASTTVTYATGWYEVVIDWLTTNTINVSVYNSSGTLFSSLTKSDSTYSSGGVGFSFWFQNGGWDTYMVKPYTPNTPTAVIGAKQSSGGATWFAAEDIAASNLSINTNLRLRFSIQNSGTAVSGQQFRLQVAAKGAAVNCESVSYSNYNDVPTTSGGCGSSPACMTTSAQFTNQSDTSGSLSYPASMRFATGTIMQDPSNQSNALTIPSNTATEVEYNLQLTNNATQSAYCFRTSNGGADLANYDHMAEADIHYAPVITNFSLNLDQPIVLTEGATTTIVASSTVTDHNGYADIVLATSTIYRSGVGQLCSANVNNCYQIASTSCSLSNCAGDSCTLQCTAPIQYLADPTDLGTYAGQNWLAAIHLKDATDLVGDATSSPVELLTLYGLSINTASIDFGALQVGQDTGTTNATTTIANTGNSQINIQLSGTDLASGVTSIPVGSLKYATTTFAYGSCSVCQFLTGSATNVAVGIPKPTSTSTPSNKDLYWGITIPNGIDASAHSGTNTFIAVSP